jgi:Tol biopolymer transport system component
MRRCRRLLAVITLAAALGAASTTPAPGSNRAAAPAGEIVFVSDRATANPGEIWALAPGTAPRDLSRSPYADVTLATAPQGRSYAFWSDRAGPWRLMISPGGGALRSVVVGGPAAVGYPSFAPVFSPDGQRLLIPFVGAGSSQRLQLAVADVRSGNARRVAAPCILPPAWSPDGRLFACVGPGNTQVSVADVLGHVHFTVPGASALWSADGRLAVVQAKQTAVLSAQGQVLERENGVARAWSPDGRALALTRPGALFLAEPGRSSALHIVYRHGDGSIYSVAFTPDGRDISYIGSNVEPTVVPVAGGASHLLPAGFAGSWSRDGRYAFAFTNTKGTTLTIKIGDRLGRRARTVGRIRFDDHGDFALAWLGDGSRLLSASSVRAHADLWTMRADGGGLRRLTSTGARISQPAWSVDGSKLAYVSAPYSGGLCGYCGGGIVIADPAAHKLSLVPGATPGSASDDGNASWSPSGTQLAVSSVYTGGVVVVGVDGSGRTELVPSDTAASPAWSPDGATIAYTSYEGGGVWGVGPTGADRRRLLPPAKKHATSVAWSPDGRLLAFTTTAGVYVSASDGSGTPRQVAAAVGPGRPSFSPDGAWLAFAAQAGTLHPHIAIYTVGVDGAGLKQITTDPHDSSDPAWRPAP